jgi:NADH-quinone oxidoreductase subunit F
VITDAAPIVTARASHQDSHELARYLATGGYEGLRKALTMTPEVVSEEVSKASLLGRGGAGFPAGRKWSMLRKAEVAYLVVNGDESEPATFKDHFLVERDPHQVIEGSIICAYAVGARQAFIFCRGEFGLGLERLERACDEAYDHGALGHRIFGSDFSLDLVIHPGAGAYICGEETALLESLEGKRGFPRIKPPYFPAAVGLYGEPTVVNNVETVSNLPWIVLHGGDAFAALGQGSSTGTRLFALSGRVNRPGWYELEMSKVTFRDLIYAPLLGGGIPHGAEMKAFIPGGVSAPWFGPEHLELGLDQDAVGKAGSMLGSGSVVVMDETTCAVRAAWRITRFFRRESCGQCTPCREGSGWLESILRRLEEGSGRESDLELLLDVCDNISPGVTWPPRQTTICVLGPSIPSSIASGIKMFRDEFLLHVKEGGCPLAGAEGHR